eukprot:3751859-Rhodomonas_salina.6
MLNPAVAREVYCSHLLMPAFKSDPVAPKESEAVTAQEVKACKPSSRRIRTRPDQAEPESDYDQQTDLDLEEDYAPIVRNVCRYYNWIQSGLGQIIISQEATSLLQDVTHLELTQRDHDEPGPSTGMMTMMKVCPGSTAYIEEGDYEHALDCELLTVRGTYLHAVPAFGQSKGYIDVSTPIALEDEVQLQFVY